MVLVTGCAGFIGFHVSMALIKNHVPVVGIDNLNEYYDPSLKKSRLDILEKSSGFNFHKIDLCDYDGLKKIFADYKPSKICHLAAQAGVRYSLSNPFAYQKSNNEGFLNIIECARSAKVENFLFASTSSVYGTNDKLPFSEKDPTDTPISLYAATKKSNELTAHSYSHLFGIPCSGLRFFTVYGPWGRPDMALFIFTKAILENKPIDVYNFGKMKRNFTYIDDIVQGVMLVLNKPSAYEIYNVGNNKTVELMDFIQEIEKNLGKKAEKNMMAMQSGDIPATEADIVKIQSLGYSPGTDVEIGVKNFVSWYIDYYKVIV